MGLAARLWDSAVIQMRQWNQADTRKRLSEGGRRGMWRRWHREQQILALMPLVDRAALDCRRMFPPHVDIADLKSAGALGLVQAAHAFHPARASRSGFAPYAYFRVRGAIIDSQRRRPLQEDAHESLEVITESERGGVEVTERAIDPRPLPDEAAARSEARRLVARAIAALDDDAERVAIRNQLAGRPIARAADALGMSQTWTRGKLTDARIRIRERIGA
jgi:RNA polymerase sigma factor (sigma-70 family)